MLLITLTINGFSQNNAKEETSYLDDVVKLYDFEKTIKSLGQVDLNDFIRLFLSSDKRDLVQTEYNLILKDTINENEVQNVYDQTITDTSYNKIFENYTISHVLNSILPDLENFVTSRQLKVNREYRFFDLDGNQKETFKRKIPMVIDGFAWGEIPGVFDRSEYIYKKLGNKGVFGIDISHHNGNIYWEDVYNDILPERLRVVLVKATDVGSVSREPFLSSAFKRNWKWLNTNRKFLYGAYHFYQPVYNSPEKQAEAFISNVELSKGDIRPIVDVEHYPNCDCADKKVNFISNLETFIRLIEKHYNTKVIIYTGDNFYKNHLHNKLDMNGRHLWVARYNSKGPFHDSAQNLQLAVVNLMIGWQFSEKGTVKGIPSKQVDLNFIFDEKLDIWLIK